ncbi:MAG TPA: methyltransferase domain-containing protein [Burkholderiales bacterium]|nr:methyltransferase domain-containing protein [Burkholderiales bacterium]
MVATLFPVWLMALLVALVTACAGAPTERERVAKIVADQTRSAADRKNDERRNPVELYSFVGARPGMRVLDISAGGGYTTELLARMVAPGGTVYAQAQKPNPRLLERMKAPAMQNVVLVVRRFDDPVPPEANGLDLVTLMFNYHDLGFLGVDRAALNRAVFQALRPGGLYVIADHSGRPGTGISESNTLHRIEESFLRREVEAAGFRLVEEGTFLRNPNDPRDRETPDPPQPKDEFVLKFVRP